MILPTSTTSTNTACIFFLEGGTLKVRNNTTNQAATAYSDTTNANVFTGTQETASPQKLSINGTEFNNAVGAANFAINNIRFGELFQDVDPLNGLIGEIVFCSGVLSTADRQSLEGYLSWKWGRQAALPSGHPYQFTPPLSGVNATVLKFSGAIFVGAGTLVAATTETEFASARLAGTAVFTASGISTAAAAAFAVTSTFTALARRWKR